MSGKAQPDQWTSTVLRCPTCGTIEADDGLAGFCGVSAECVSQRGGFLVKTDMERVEVVPAAERDRLRAENEALKAENERLRRHAGTWPDEPCGCARTCGDDGDIDGPGTCKGLPAKREPLVEVVCVPRRPSDEHRAA